jgi:3-dehydroquinate dehydratase-1
MTPPANATSPYLVGVVANAQAVARFAAAPERLVDVLEVRCDLFEGPFDARALERLAPALAGIEAAGTPVLVTLRLASQGGEWTQPDEARLPLYQTAVETVSWVDVEGASAIARDVVAAAHARGRRAILSHHDFQTTPPLAELDRVVTDALAAGADIAKVATLVATNLDRDALFELLARHAGRACVIGMGERSSELRTELPARGSRLAYAYVDAPTAPGQLSVLEMDARLRIAAPAYAERRSLTA